ncbi:hemagglutinin repeat-containing protein [Dickeya zeae]|uniref:hemagglutinin repeat-containing protein n=1 Tax=Dickeya zeae TaxID=204042 RepID=UPI001C62AC33|nr:hemagglutinin repeat-containing protein [Dickeya zeae]
MVFFCAEISTDSGSDVSLSAGNTLTVTAAEERDAQTHLREETHAGLMGSGGIGFTIGSNSQKTTTAESAQQHRGSTVGSSTGSLTLNAGGSLGVAGSELIAGEDVTLKGRDVSVVSLENRQDRQETREQKQSGLTIALSGSVGGALNTAVETAQSSRETQDGRVKALQQTKAALSVAQGVQAARLAQAQSEGAGGQQGGQTVGVSVSYGSQSSTSVQAQTQTTAQGSSVTAGRNLSVTATDGDVTVAGSTLKAGQDLLLDASRDIRLLSSANTQHTEGSNQSQGGSIGVSLGVSASGSFGLSVSASVNAAKGSQHGDGVTHTEALLEAGRAAVLHSGRDTTLQGAQVNAETIKAQVGRDLLIRSEQDSDHYDSKQQSMSAGVTIPIYGGGGGANFSFSRDRVNSNFESVQEQSGLFAGRGGFDVTVGNHTQLDGGAIASTAEAEKNRLDTGTLGFSNIDNHAEYSASHSGGGFSTSAPVGLQVLSNVGGLALAGANQSGSSSGTTYAAVSDGTLIIRDRAGQQQDVSGLSRDTAGANSGALNPIFDKEKVESKLQQAQLMSDIGAQALDIASTEGAIAATKAANDKVAAASAAERRAKGSELAQANPNKAITQDDVTQALTGAAAPYMAEAIHRATTDAAGNTDVAANTLAHALLGAVVAQASGNNALAGAAGEAGGELAARALMEALYPGKKPSELNEEQKQYISTLATIAGGLAAGVVGNTGADAVQGAQSAQVAVENNYLSSTDKSRQTYLNHKENLTEQEKQERDALNRKDLESDLAAIKACQVGGSDCQAERNKALEALNTYTNLSYLNPKEAQAGYQQIQSLLNSTDPLAKDAFNVLEGYTQALMRFGYTEEEARARAGVYIGGMYLYGGVSAIVASKELVKQFGEDIAVGNKSLAAGAANSLVKNADGIYEVKMDSTPLEGQQRLNTPDINGNGKYNPAEAAAAARLENVLGTLERAPDTGGKTADFIISSGSNAGKTVDFMYTTKNLSQKEVDGINKFFEKNMTVVRSPGKLPAGQQQILDHLNKADIVPVDFSVLSPSNQKLFTDFIKTLPDTQQQKVIIMR